MRKKTVVALDLLVCIIKFMLWSTLLTLLELSRMQSVRRSCRRRRKHW